MDIQYRLLTIDDAAIFRELRLRSLKEEPRAFVHAYEDVVTWPMERFSKYFENGWLIGAFVGGKLVAMAGIKRFSGLKVQHKGNLWGVYVVPEARGLGCARRIIEILIDYAKQAGLELLFLGAEDGNETVLSLYRGLGFEPCGMAQHTFKLPEGYVDDVLMIKFLDKP